MNITTVPSFTAKLYIGGDIQTAKRLINKMVYFEGMCVTIDPTTFVYTGGEEAGMVIGLINYPRFPSAPEQIKAKATAIGDMLIRELNQRTYLILCSDETYWMACEPPGAKS